MHSCVCECIPVTAQDETPIDGVPQRHAKWLLNVPRVFRVHVVNSCVQSNYLYGARRQKVWTRDETLIDAKWLLNVAARVVLCIAKCILLIVVCNQITFTEREGRKYGLEMRHWSMAWRSEMRNDCWMCRALRLVFDCSTCTNTPPTLLALSGFRTIMGLWNQKQIHNKWT